MTDVAGRSVKADSGRVSGVYRGRDTVHRGEKKSPGVGVGSGLVLLSPQARDTLAKRGVAVVETQDVSNDKSAFSVALDAARNSDTVNGWAVTPKSVADLEESGAKLVMSANGSTGLAITPDGDIEAVFANKAAGAPKGVTKATIPQAIANGGTKLDCYGEGLVTLYAKYGFVPVARVKFNPEYANPGWDASKGTPDIFFMMHSGDSADTVIQKMGKYHRYTESELNALPVMDYDEAYSYRDSLLANRATTPVAETQPTGDISTPPTAQSVKQGTSDALNSAVNYNSRETQTEAPSQAQKNTAPTQETTRTIINDDPATHTAEENQIIADYKAAVDESLKETIEEYYGDPQKGFSRHNISSVTEKQAHDISNILGGNYSGYKNAINANGIKHILNEHGPNGTVNQSMGDINDIARVGYVLENYDTVSRTTYASGDPKYSDEFRDSSNKPAPMVTFSKKVNGTYFVVEAVPDTKYKKLWVVSAYLGEKGDVTQAPNAKNLGNTSNTALASPPQENSSPKSSDAGKPTSNVTPEANLEILESSDTSISPTPQNVKQNFEGNGAPRERGVSKNVRTDTAMEKDLRESFNQSPEMYTQLTNKETLAKAKEIYAKGYEHARSEVERAIGKGKAIRADFIEAKKCMPKMTVREMLESYIDSRRAVLSPSTIRGYEYIKKMRFSSVMEKKSRQLIGKPR